MSAPVTAHRGLARIYPENTRSSVLGALRAGLDKVEIDIQLSADGVPVLLHDSTLRRMAARAGDVRKMLWKDLKTVPVPEPGRFGQRFATEKLLSLNALARILAGKPALRLLFVELKEESLRTFGRQRMLQAVLAALKPIQRRCVIISFDLEVLTLVRASTRLPVGPVLRNLKQLQNASLRDLKPNWIFCNAKLLPRQGRLQALFGKAQSCVYEVPDPVQARALLKRGISALETFQADSLARGLREMGRPALSNT